MKNLVLDMGNVVVYFDHRRACRQIAALGRAGTTEEAVFARLFHQPLEREYDEGRLSTAQFLTALRDAFGIAAPDEAIAHAWTDIFRPNRVLARQLATLRTAVWHLVLASNTNRLHAAHVEHLMPDTLALFDRRVLSFEVGVRKPAEAFYRAVIEQAQVEPADCLYVDDRADFVAAAEALGFSGLVYQADAEIPAARLT